MPDLILIALGVGGFALLGRLRRPLRAACDGAPP